MSLECSECEHDLRGGHAITCSRWTPTCGECGEDVPELEYLHKQYLELSEAVREMLLLLDRYPTWASEWHVFQNKRAAIERLLPCKGS